MPAEICRINAIRVARRVPVVVMLRAPVPCFRKNAMPAASYCAQFGYVNREVSTSVYRTNAIFAARRSTGCCDAQGAGAVVSRKNAMSRPSWCRVNREVSAMDCYTR